MSTFNNSATPSLAEMAKPQTQALSSSEHEVQSESTLKTIRLPSTLECVTHLQLLNNFFRLKIAVDEWGQKKNMAEDQAWKQFCDIAANKFLEWSRNVDTSNQNIPIPSLDVLMVWHSFMLNPRDYMRYANKVLQGRFGGKGIDWQQLVSIVSPVQSTWATNSEF